MLTQEQKQQLFDKAVGATLKQGRACRSDKGGYEYQRVINGQEYRCAIGHLMADDDPLLHSPHTVIQLLAGSRINDQVKPEVETMVLDGITVTKDDAAWLDALQCLHDNAASTTYRGIHAEEDHSIFLDRFKKAIVGFAANHELSTAKVL